jgi:hypothetical protein
MTQGRQNRPSPTFKSCDGVILRQSNSRDTAVLGPATHLVLGRSRFHDAATGYVGMVLRQGTVRSLCRIRFRIRHAQAVGFTRYKASRTNPSPAGSHSADLFIISAPWPFSNSAAYHINLSLETRDLTFHSTCQSQSRTRPPLSPAQDQACYPTRRSLHLLVTSVAD